jgi:hypothetical protein
VYFTVFASEAQEGGLYVVDQPPECTSTQSGGDTTPDAGASGGLDAGVGADCKPDGDSCGSSVDCCSGSCVDTPEGRMCMARCGP